MQWVQTRQIDGAYRSSRRFKCNRCGTTQEIPFTADPDHLPDGWGWGRHQGWHVCPGCQTRKMPLLPVVG